MSCVVVTIPNIDQANTIRRMLLTSGRELEVVVCSNGAETLNEVHKRKVNLVICCGRFNDMNYDRLFDCLPAGTGMLLLTRNAALALQNSNIMKLVMPFKRDDLLRSVGLLLPAASYGAKKDRKQGDTRPHRTPEEEKLILRAKSALMEHNGMTEPEPFRFLQKSSMDSGRSLTESAQMVLLMF